MRSLVDKVTHTLPSQTPPSTSPPQIRTSDPRPHLSSDFTMASRNINRDTYSHHEEGIAMTINQIMFREEESRTRCILGQARDRHGKEFSMVAAVSPTAIRDRENHDTLAALIQLQKDRRIINTVVNVSGTMTVTASYSEPKQKAAMYFRLEVEKVKLVEEAGVDDLEDDILPSISQFTKGGPRMALKRMQEEEEEQATSSSSSSTPRAPRLNPQRQKTSISQLTRGLSNVSWQY